MKNKKLRTTNNPRKIKRTCAVCGKRITVTIYQDGHHRDGYYFKTIKLPIGKGEYKKTGSVKLGKNKYDVVKWTGKEKEVEYWECKTCFEEASHECWLEEMTEKLFGKKCREYEPGCACCQAWNVYDTIIEENRGLL